MGIEPKPLVQQSTALTTRQRPLLWTLSSTQKFSDLHFVSVQGLSRTQWVEGSASIYANYHLGSNTFPFGSQGSRAHYNILWIANVQSLQFIDTWRGPFWPAGRALVHFKNRTLVHSPIYFVSPMYSSAVCWYLERPGLAHGPLHWFILKLGPSYTVHYTLDHQRTVSAICLVSKNWNNTRAPFTSRPIERCRFTTICKNVGLHCAVIVVHWSIVVMFSRRLVQRRQALRVVNKQFSLIVWRVPDEYKRIFIIII